MAHFHPVPDRRGVPLKDLPRPVQQPDHEIRTESPDFPLGIAIPQHAAAIDAQIDRDDASDDLTQEKPHARTRSSRMDSTTGPHGSSIGGAVIALALPGLVRLDLVLVQWQGRSCVRAPTIPVAQNTAAICWLLRAFRAGGGQSRSGAPQFGRRRLWGHMLTPSTRNDSVPRVTGLRDCSQKRTRKDV